MQNLMGERIRCKCGLCNCQKEFEIIETEELINLIQHGRLNQEQINFLKRRVDCRTCKQCFIGNHSN